MHNVARNKGAPGVDGRSVREVVAASPRLLFTLRRELLGGGYRPGDIRRVWIPKPGGGQRGLGIPNVVDRWVQEAVRINVANFLDHFGNSALHRLDQLRRFVFMLGHTTQQPNIAIEVFERLGFQSDHRDV